MDIENAISSTYTLTKDDIDCKITVEITDEYDYLVADDSDTYAHCVDTYLTADNEAYVPVAYSMDQLNLTVGSNLLQVLT